MATAPPLPAFSQPPSYEETLVAPPPPLYHPSSPAHQGNASGPAPPQGYASGPAPPQGYASGPAPPQGYASGPAPPQGYVCGPPPPGYIKVPQSPYPPPPANVPGSNNMMSVQTVYVQPNMVFGERPVQVHCPNCSQLVLTRTEYSSGTMTWLSCLGLSIFGCIYGCCLIPFCVNSLKDVKHSCPNCNSHLGIYKRI